MSGDEPGAWAPDVLGDEFEQRTLPLGTDDEGEVVATLVRALPQHSAWQRLFGDRRRLADTDVLYVHGWSDYFFQKRLDLHGWIYDIESGGVEALDGRSGQFVALARHPQVVAT